MAGERTIIIKGKAYGFSDKCIGGKASDPNVGCEECQARSYGVMQGWRDGAKLSAILEAANSKPVGPISRSCWPKIIDVLGAEEADWIIRESVIVNGLKQ